ncbi:hypothetical protein NLJ89_g766 [Agrocybe chaxingu]|uniref:Uncharacterized protein n=1 Tax=Agrocybe chaxingu TaxID=84603 RepID=A0A9W8N171_9AGAR|nr:hypothetical protein NLJ89_g766 [Agrocybe chaxingu]
MPGQNLSFGLLLLHDFQWLVAGPVDLINSHSRANVQSIGSLRSLQELIEKAPVITWHYIPFGRSPGHAPSTPLQPTRTVLRSTISSFMDPIRQSLFLQGLLTVCTRSMVVGTTGLLDGYKVCANKFAPRGLHAAGLLNKKVTWVGDRRWIADRKVWSAAGVTTGLDLGADFVRVNFDPKLVEFVKEVVEYKANPAQPDDFAYILDDIDYNN